MDLLSNLALGFSAAFAPENLLYCFIGSLLGTVIGVLPGVGPVATIALLLPLTFSLPPLAAMIMLAGIFYGAQYGGSTTAILVNLPGETSSVMTCLDGYQMARQGRAGPALAIAAIGSFFAGTISTLLVAAVAKPLSGVALNFGQTEFFSLIVLGLVATVALASGSTLKALAMASFGLVLGLVGADINSGTHRFTFGVGELADGINFASVAVGLFGFSEILRNLADRNRGEVTTAKIGSLLPSREDAKASWKPILRGTGLGAALGVLPGAGNILAAFAAYSLEKTIARDPSRFGRGAIEGVAAPEAANNAGAQTSFIPMLTLGIPTSPVMALLVGALIIQGIPPGPTVMNEQPVLFWGLIASMWIGNLMLIILNLPLVGIWVRLLRVPYQVMYPAIILFACIGIYSINNALLDVAFAAGFGLFGYILMKLDCEPAPLMLGFILGPMMEESFRRAMMISRGDPMIFLSRPISLGFLVVTAVLLVVLMLPAMRAKREKVFQE